MAKVFIEETSLTAIGNAIRAKTGGTEALTVPTGMVNAIASITGGGETVDSHEWEDWRLSGNGWMTTYFNDRITYLASGGLAGAQVSNVILPKVEGLGEISLARMNSLFKVHIPKVTRIYSNAFQNTGDYNTGFDINAPEVTYIDSYAFYNSYLKAAIFPKVTELNGDMFYGAQKLVIADFPALETSGNFVNAFNYCSALKCVNMPKFTEIPYGTFGQNYDTYAGLNYLTLPSCTRVNGAFAGVYGLRKLDLGQCQTIGSYSFDCPELNTLVLRYDGVCTLEQDASSEFNNSKICSDQTGYIYVPAAHIDAYKTATNWVTVANQFRTIEDYEGELIFGCIYDESEGVATSGTYQGLTEITGIVLPNISASESDGDASGSFTGCTKLYYVRLDKATTVGGLGNCQSLIRVDIPNCTTLADYTFIGDRALKYLNLPKVTNVGDYAFKNTELTNIVLRSSVKADGKSTMFDGVSSYPTLWVPAALVDAYSADTNWNMCTIKTIEGSIYEEV